MEIHSDDEEDRLPSEKSASLSSSTNRLERPEWFYRHCRTILDEPSGPVDFLDAHVQPLLASYSLTGLDPVHGLVFRIVQLGRKR